MSRTKSRKQADAGALLNDLAGMLDSGKPEVEKAEQQEASSRSNTENLPAGDQAEREGETGEPGSPVSSEPDPDDYLEEDYRQEEDGEEPDFTATDVQDFDRLDGEVTKACRQTFEALGEIRRRKLYKVPKDDSGNRLYPTFDAYVEERHGHTRTWVTKGTNWLRVLKALDKLGIRVSLGLKAAQALVPWKVKAAGGLRAIFDEALRENLPLTYESLAAVIERRRDFFGNDTTPKPSAPTYQQYRQDLVTIASLGNGSYGLLRDAKGLSGDLADNLVRLCQERKQVPSSEDLLHSFTGDALTNIVDKLKDVGNEVAEIEEKKKLLAARRKEIKAMQQQGGLRKLKEEEKALKRELEAKGALKSKKNGALSPPQGANNPTASGEDEDDEPDVSEVRDNLKSSLDYLNDALTCDWPQEEDAAELDAILMAAQDCETKLAEITAKAKELLADAEEPEEIPSGND